MIHTVLVLLCVPRTAVSHLILQASRLPTMPAQIEKRECVPSHMPDVASAAYVLAELWCIAAEPASVDVHIGLEDSMVRVQFKRSCSLGIDSARQVDAALLHIRPRCSSLTFRVLRKASAEARTMSMPPRATQYVAQFWPCLRLDALLQGWKGSTGFTGCGLISYASTVLFASAPHHVQTHLRMCD